MESYYDSHELLLATDTFDQITFKILSMMQKLDSSAIEMVQVRMQIAFDLKRLYDIILCSFYSFYFQPCFIYRLYEII
jgi:hypothetical protein